VAIQDEEPGWIHLCPDGSYARQVVVQKLPTGKLRFYCKNTGGQSAAFAKKLLDAAQALVDEKGIDWGVYVEEVDE
jgi:hypothetical protein